MYTHTHTHIDHIFSSPSTTKSHHSHLLSFFPTCLHIPSFAFTHISLFIFYCFAPLGSRRHLSRGVHGTFRAGRLSGRRPLGSSRFATAVTPRPAATMGVTSGGLARRPLVLFFRPAGRRRCSSTSGPCGGHRHPPPGPRLRALHQAGWLGIRRVSWSPLTASGTGATPSDGPSRPRRRSLMTCRPIALWRPLPPHAAPVHQTATVDPARVSLGGRFHSGLELSAPGVAPAITRSLSLSFMASDKNLVQLSACQLPPDGFAFNQFLSK